MATAWIEKNLADIEARITNLKGAKRLEVERVSTEAVTCPEGQLFKLRGRIIEFDNAISDLEAIAREIRRSVSDL